MRDLFSEIVHHAKVVERYEGNPTLSPENRIIYHNSHRRLTELRSEVYRMLSLLPESALSAFFQDPSRLRLHQPENH